jgi:hypothetical protein
MNYPVHAESQGGFTYPTHLLFGLFVPFWFSHNLNILLHLIIGAIFFYLLLKQFNLDCFSSVFGSFAFILSSHFSLHIGILPFIETGAYLAIFIYIVKRIENEPDYKKSVILGAVVGLSLLLGHFNFTIYAILLSFLYILIFTPVKLYKRIIYLVIASAVGIGISAVQIIPTSELAILSGFSGSSGISGSYSFNPINLITTLFPSLFGESIHPPSIITENPLYLFSARNYIKFWGFGSYFENLIYTGVPTIILAIYSIYNKRNKYIKFFLWAILISLFLALGKFNPVSTIIHKIPPLSFTRIPSRFLFIAIFSISVLAGFGFNKLNKASKLKSFSIFLIISMIIILLMIAFSGYFINKYQTDIKNLLLNRYGDEKGGPIKLSTDGYKDKISSELNRSRQTLSVFYSKNLIQIIIFSLIIIIILLINRFGFINLFKFMILAILIIDLFIFSFGRNEFIKPDMLFKNDFFQNDTEKDIRIFSSGWDIDKSYQYHSILAPNTNVFLQLTQVNPRCSLLTTTNELSEQTLLHSIYKKGAGEYPLKTFIPADNIKNLSILKRLNISYIFRTRKLTSPDAYLESIENGVYYYKIKEPLKHIYCSNTIEYVNSQIDALEKLNTPVDNEENPVIYVEKKYKGFIRLNPDENFHWTILNKSYSDKSISFDFAGSDTLCIVNDLYYPGWHTYIDDKEIKTFRAFGFVRGFVIPDGEHKIVMKYEPLSFKIGLITTLLSIILASVIIISLRNR